MGAYTRSFAAAAGLLFLASCGSSSSTNVTAPSTAQCAVTLTSDSPSVSATGGDGKLTIAINRECAWNARSDVDWISITSAASGQGGATVSFHIAANSATGARRGGISVNDRRVDVSQAGSACTFSLNRTQDSIDSAGGKRTISVSAPGSCAWAATSQAGWIAIAAGSSGTGNGSVTVDISPNLGPMRTGTVVIAGQRYTVSQGAPGAPPPPPPPAAVCTFALSTTTQAIGASGGPVSLNVSAGDGCAWTATSQVPWLTITAGASGTGIGMVQYTATANTDPTARVGSLTVAGQAVTVTQAPPPPPACTFVLSAMNKSFTEAGGTGTVTLTSPAACAWDAISNATWITVTAGAASTGNGTVQYTVAANGTTSPRAGTITIAGQLYTVNQAGTPCTYGLSATNQAMSASGGAGSVNVTAPTGCAWTATSNASWLSILFGSSGNGNGTVQFNADANSTTSPRSGNLTIAGQTFTVTEPAPAPAACTFHLSATGLAIDAAGGSRSVTVDAPSTCDWTAASNAPWLTITSGANSSGNATVQFTVGANPDPTSRTGTLTVAGQTFTVNQTGTSPGPCTFGVAPMSLSVAANASSNSVNVTTTSTCAWTAVSNAPWLTLTGSTGASGSGNVPFNIAENTDTSSRSGTLTVAGQTVTINQAAAAPAPCTFDVAPLTISVSSDATSKDVAVTTGATCSWTAASNAPWLTLGSSGDTGSGNVSVSIAENTDTSSRSGTVTIAGATVTVNQGAAPPPPCTFSLSTSSLTPPAAGGDDSVHVSASASSCGWTASSDVPWMTVTGGASGTGDGDVSVHFDANPDPSPRSGTLTIAGHPVSVTQEAGP